MSFRVPIQNYICKIFTVSYEWSYSSSLIEVIIPWPAHSTPGSDLQASTHFMLPKPSLYDSFKISSFIFFFSEYQVRSSGSSHQAVFLQNLLLNQLLQARFCCPWLQKPQSNFAWWWISNATFSINCDLPHLFTLVLICYGFKLGHR